MFFDRLKRDCMNIKLIFIEDGVCSFEVLNLIFVRIIKLLIGYCCFIVGGNN